MKKAEAIGRGDLFGSMADEGNPTIGLDFHLPDDEWPRRQKLALEREMLGLYVSAHPLDGAEHILSQHRDVSIAELLGSGQTQGDVRLAGLIAGVERRMTKQGNAWATVQLADRDGQIDVLYFPQTYQLVAHELIEDNVISVSGNLKERDGVISIMGRELKVLDVASAEGGGKPPVVLLLPERRITPGLVAEIKRTLEAHPGDNPVRIRVEGPRRPVLLEAPPRVQLEHGAFASEIKTLLGPNSWIGTA